MHDIAGTIAKTDLLASSITPEEAMGHFGWMTNIVTMDAPASSLLTQARFLWQPQEVHLVTDMRENGYSA